MSIARDIEQLHTWIRECKKGGMVFFGGAGVSTESGIPDFRSSDGLFMQDYQIPPEQIVSHSFFMQYPEQFFDFYFNHMIFPEVKPNQAHRKLAELEQEGILSSVITQNVDGLHQKAGSNKVLELHGSSLKNYCVKCKKRFSLEEFMALRQSALLDEMKGENYLGVPRCPECGGIVRPDVVLYEEMLNDDTITKSVQYISNADVLIIGGTSLNVYPAAGFINYFRGSKLVIINKAATSADKNADLVISEPIGEVLGSLKI